MAKVGNHYNVYIDGEPPFDGWAKAVCVEFSERKFFVFYEGIEWENPIGDVDDFDNYVKLKNSATSGGIGKRTPQ